MTTELARRAENLPVEYLAERPMRLVEWAEEARAAHALATSLCETPFAGAYKGNAGGATAAILKGSEVGLTPVTSLGAFDLIQGTPAPKALTLRALVQSHGHSIWIETSTDKECIAKAVRRGENQVHESRWTIARAAAMGLTSKQNWKQQPAAMLAARATSEVCRLVAADVILGIGYSSEEILDAIPEPTTTVRRNADPPKTTTARRAQPAAQPEPDLEPPTLGADTPIPPDDNPKTGGGGGTLAETSVAEGAAGSNPASNTPPPSDLVDPHGKQMKALHASLNDAGLGGRDAGLSYLTALLDRDITSTKDLTVAEASLALGDLKDTAERFPTEPPLTGDEDE